MWISTNNRGAAWFALLRLCLARISAPNPSTSSPPYICSFVPLGRLPGLWLVGRTHRPLSRVMNNRLPGDFSSRNSLRALAITPHSGECRAKAAPGKPMLRLLTPKSVGTMFCLIRAGAGGCVCPHGFAANETIGWSFTATAKAVRGRRLHGWFGMRYI